MHPDMYTYVSCAHLNTDQQFPLSPAVFQELPAEPRECVPIEILFEGMTMSRIMAHHHPACINISAIDLEVCRWNPFAGCIQISQYYEFNLILRTPCLHIQVKYGNLVYILVKNQALLYSCWSRICWHNEHWMKNFLSMNYKQKQVFRSLYLLSVIAVSVKVVLYNLIGVGDPTVWKPLPWLRRKSTFNTIVIS